MQKYLSIHTNNYSKVETEYYMEVIHINLKQIDSWINILF